MCPAVIFAARRNERVKGRTRTLDVSIRTRNGFNHSGAPSGRKCAVEALGLKEKLEMIILSQIGSPRDRVRINWLESLKEYGIRPMRLIRIIKINRLLRTEDSPFKDLLLVRDNWDIIMEALRRLGVLNRLHKRLVVMLRQIMNIKVRIKRVEVEGMMAVYSDGSKEEKMSGIIQDSGGA